MQNKFAAVAKGSRKPQINSVFSKKAELTNFIEVTQVGLAEQSWIPHYYF